MKTLYVIRHAKSSWDDPELTDFERPLNERGKKDAPRMGKRLKEKDIHPQLLLSSPAKRAFSTSKRIADAIGYSRENIKTEKELYHADAETILSILRKLGDNISTLMIFGHNPGLTDFVNQLGKNTSIENIPTCGVVAFSLRIEHWRDLGFNSGELIFFDYPKSTKD